MEAKISTMVPCLGHFSRCFMIWEFIPVMDSTGQDMADVPASSLTTVV